MVNVPHCHGSTCQRFIKQTENMSSRHLKCIFLSKKMYELHSEPGIVTRDGIVVK